MTMSAVIENQEIRVKGTVQGVGFRPTVYRLALECELNGEVSNDTDGVLIRLSGQQHSILRFLQRLPLEAPPLAKIDSIEANVVAATWQYRDFRIGHSGHTQGRTEVAADAAVCQACLAEIHDPAQRRYQYPFTNCTHCGPRLSIVQGIPYDRPNTTMAAFALCPECHAEYTNPLDRRFHAQPIACHECGPQLHIHGDNHRATSNSEQSRHCLAQIDLALRAGKIVAIKGLGGFHLCCDAANHASVQLLRQRKQRYAKPFALMSHQLDGITQYCTVSALEQATLQSAAGPIVLLASRAKADMAAAPLSAAIAPGSALLGWMLPTTPLHQLICQRFGQPLVMTSGNVSGEPQIIDNQEAIDKLSSIADLLVLHNREIANRIDDSVVMCVSGRARLLRRARGYAPRSITLPAGFEQADKILAWGAELKSTFCLVKQGAAILSQHQGDLEDISTIDDYEKNLALYQKLFGFSPRVLALDRHPEYLSGKLAKAKAEAKATADASLGDAATRLRCVEIQHHHAHIASAMAENGLPLTHRPVLGIAFDGLGFGADNTLWGGEFLLADYHSARRLARLKPVAMPGGAQAIKQPWRNTLAHILNSMSWQDFCAQHGDSALAAFLAQKPVASLQTMLAAQLNCPLASSAGRLFDAVAGALGINPGQVQFEGQAAIELEMLVDKNAILEPDPLGAASQAASTPGTDAASLRPYRFALETASHPDGPLLNLDPAPMWLQLLQDLQHGVDKSMIATRFHAGLIHGVMQVVDLLAQQHEFGEVVLSGGCMQNAILLQGLEQALAKRQLNCITHALVPANDGGIALGQAVIAAANMLATPSSNHSLSGNHHQLTQRGKSCV
jgi:hydrogenase maturation protein HypF